MTDGAKGSHRGPPDINVCKPQAVASTPHGQKLLVYHMTDIGMTRNCWVRYGSKSLLNQHFCQRNYIKRLTLIYDKVANIQGIHKLEKHPDLASSAFLPVLR